MSNPAYPAYPVVCKLCQADLGRSDAEMRVAHYQGHIAEDTRKMAESLQAQRELISQIAQSSFLNPRHAVESAAERVERVGGAR